MCRPAKNCAKSRSKPTATRNDTQIKGLIPKTSHGLTALGPQDPLDLTGHSRPCILVKALSLHAGPLQDWTSVPNPANSQHNKSWPRNRALNNKNQNAEPKSSSKFMAIQAGQDVRADIPIAFGKFLKLLLLRLHVLFRSSADWLKNRVQALDS